MSCAVALWGLLPVASNSQVVVLNAEEYRDKVYGCWLGKNIGGTLGAPFEGQRQTQNVSFYTNLKPGEPAPNDDLDLQMLWLKALEERGLNINARILGEYWLSYVPVDWNEYGIGKANMRLGLMPPLSGHYNNKQWRDSNGAWIRSEIWACLAPGCPDIAARYAYEDAVVDHGGGEGVNAEIFTATVESAAFVEKDRDRLLEIGLSRIPPDCATAKAVRAAIDAYKKGLDWAAAREAVVKATEDTGWFQAPRNVAFVVVGWLYGEGDFGKSICAAVNCGDDTDCTGATLGSILGIILGRSGIPDKWKDPIGDKINTVAIANFQPPQTLAELTNRTVALAHQMLLA
ncbi:MAG: ADP-ribosylglycohydrolase family protein, partial [Anaerolineae bacterium]